MQGIVILSPHRDDAVFSLGMSLVKWSRLDFKLKVINFFTITAYAPRAGTDETAKVGDIRRREDRAAIARISRSIEIVDRNLLDAPLRLGITAADVCQIGRAIPEELLKRLQYLMRVPGEMLTLAPLGLGNHIDHLSVREAALRGTAPSRLAFYEDLPYATWTEEKQLRKRILEVETRLSCRFKPVIVKRHCTVSGKRALVGRYRSQISPEEANVIAGWSRRYRGERIWVPLHSRYWRRAL
jgi:LmbE family N-acetylglucosaminyl deacetylase